MSVDEQTFQVGGTLEPLAASSSNTLLQDADPALFFALDFFSWVIGFFAGPRLLAAASALHLSTIASAVAQRYPDDPDEYLQENQLKFPLLAMYRKDTRYEFRRAGWSDDHVSFDLLYVLPPLTAGQAEQILPILTAIEKAIRYKTVQSFDPGYTPPGGTAGQTPWGLQFAAVEEIGFERGHRIKWQNKGNLSFPTLHMEGFFKERDMYVAGQHKFTGADIEVDLLAPDQTAIAPFIQSSTQQAPTITSLSTTTGSASGGTSVTITGTLFLSGPPRVLFGTTYATSVTFNSATSLTAVTPAVGGNGVVDVSVVNRDGQFVTKPKAFTYTVP